MAERVAHRAWPPVTPAERARRLKLMAERAESMQQRIDALRRKLTPQPHGTQAPPQRDEEGTLG